MNYLLHIFKVLSLPYSIMIPFVFLPLLAPDSLSSISCFHKFLSPTAQGQAQLLLMIYILAHSAFHSCLLFIGHSPQHKHIPPASCDLPLIIQTSFSEQAQLWRSPADFMFPLSLSCYLIPKHLFNVLRWRFFSGYVSASPLFSTTLQRPAVGSS